MRKATRLSLLAFWILLATGLLTRLWLTNPGAFPQVPETVAIRLAELYGSRNGEELAELEIWFGLSVSFIAVTLATGLG